MFTTSVNNQRFIAFKNAMSVIGTDYTTIFFYCLYQQTWNDGITGNVRNEFHLSLIKKYLITGSTYT